MSQIKIRNHNQTTNSSRTFKHSTKDGHLRNKSKHSTKYGHMRHKSKHVITTRPQTHHTHSNTQQRMVTCVTNQNTSSQPDHKHIIHIQTHDKWWSRASQIKTIHHNQTTNSSHSFKYSTKDGHVRHKSKHIISTTPQTHHIHSNTRQMMVTCVTNQNNSSQPDHKLIPLIQTHDK